MNLNLILLSDLGDSRDEDERIEDGSLEHGGPQQHLLPPHHFGRLPHLQERQVTLVTLFNDLVPPDVDLYSKCGSRSMQQDNNSFTILSTNCTFPKGLCTNQVKRLLVSVRDL